MRHRERNLYRHEPSVSGVAAGGKTYPGEFIRERVRFRMGVSCVNSFH